MRVIEVKVIVEVDDLLDDWSINDVAEDIAWVINKETFDQIKVKSFTANLLKNN